MSKIDDEALAFLLADAEARGLSLAEYERRYGIILEMPLPPPAKHRILRHEVPGGLMTAAELSLARHKERRRAFTRRRPEEPVETPESEDPIDPS